MGKIMKMLERMISIHYPESINQRHQILLNLSCPFLLLNKVIIFNFFLL